MVTGHYAFAEAKAYDGIWFLGFNVNEPPFDNLKVRQAVAHCLDRESIASFIPPGMPGYDPELKPYKLNAQYAKTLMKRAGFGLNDKRLKNISLLHTDGVKTIEIAKAIQNDLRQIGIKIDRVQARFRDEEKWNKELSSKKFPLFLMGYKAEPERLFTDEASASGPDSARLLEPLFKTDGSANFTGFSDPTADMLFDQLSVISSALLREREVKLKEINIKLYKELPAIVLFYIEKL